MISFVAPAGGIFLANLARIEKGNEQTQEQIASGHQINQISDSPDQISQLLQLDGSQARNTQVQTNLTNAQTNVDASDQALTNVLQLVDQANSLGTQGASSTVTAQTRLQLAGQVQDIFNQVLSISRTSVGGRYIFSGDTDQSPAYQANPSNQNGVDRLSLALNTSPVEDTNGTLIPVGLTAGQIFDHRNSDDTLASDNLFAALTSLQNALKNNDTTAIGSAIGSLQQASSYVNTQQGFYGGVQNQLTQALSTASSQKLALDSQIASIRDTDLSEAAIQLTQGTTAYQSALQAQSKVPHTSLFDFLG